MVCYENFILTMQNWYFAEQLTVALFKLFIDTSV